MGDGSQEVAFEIWQEIPDGFSFPFFYFFVKYVIELAGVKKQLIWWWNITKESLVKVSDAHDYNMGYFNNKIMIIASWCYWLCAVQLNYS